MIASSHRVVAEIDSDPRALAVAFVIAARREGIALTAHDATALVTAWSTLDELTPLLLFLSARAVLAGDVAEYPAIDRALSSLLTNSAGVDDGVEEIEEWIQLGAGEEAASESGDAAQLTASRREQLGARDLATLSESERQLVEDALVTLLARMARRRRRRNHSVRGHGESLDLRASARGARRHGGEIVALVGRRRRTEVRRLIFLLDVSGSMAAYTSTYLHFIVGAHQQRPRVELFTLGTQLTRLTRVVRGHDRRESVAELVPQVVDWSGGTRLGEVLRRFNDEYAIRGLGRQATVVMLSDGLERGDPILLGEEMARLSRVAHEIIWVNPLRGIEGYLPLAGGMHAALPFVDHFLAGHSLDALAELAELLGESA